MKIALYKNVKFNYITIWEVYDDEPPTEYVRISEVIEVDFPMLKNKEVTNKEIAVLEKEKTNIQAETQIKLNALDRRIGELLALPHKD